MSNKKSIYFSMAIHNHQPVGNLDPVFEEAYDKSYLPMLELLAKHPRMKMGLHNTGPLWDKYSREKPRWLELIRNLSKNGQLEMISGGYYEPILINLSDRDKIGQIKKMNKKLYRETNTKPNGLWCAERIWEPSLAKPISLADIKYTVLDESHFRYAGLEEKDTFGYFITEEQGHPLNIFCINQNLRYMMPFTPAEEIIAYLEKWATEEGTRLAFFADDGEKFGLWPQTYKQVWEEGWMEKFVTLLEQNSDWIRVVTPSEYMKKFPPLDRVYIPTASYSGMAEWTLPFHSARKYVQIQEEVKKVGKEDEYNTFLRGGFWRNFLVKYPESNRIQKKTLLVSEKIQTMTGPNKDKALDLLYQAQCNCPYWHGLFGGIYIPHLRQAIQNRLIQAESLADNEFHRNSPFQEIEELDINLDSFKEVLINTKNFNIQFSPAKGGAIESLDYKPVGINYCDTLTRREESYHNRIDENSKVRQLSLKEQEKGQSEPETFDKELYLRYDRYRRLSFIDHFVEDNLDIKDFWKHDYDELGDFVEKPYDIFKSSKDDKAVLTLSRKGKVRIGGKDSSLEIEKTFFIPEGGETLRIQYWLINSSKEELNLNFGVEMDFSFLSRDMETNFILVEGEKEEEEIKEDKGKEKKGKDKSDEEMETETADNNKKYPFNSATVLENQPQFSLIDGDRGVNIRIETGESCKTWFHPVETISGSEAGFEKTFQSLVVMPVWKLKLDPGDEWDDFLTITFSQITGS